MKWSSGRTLNSPNIMKVFDSELLGQLEDTGRGSFLWPVEYGVTTTKGT
jgi:hypothetical protein